TGWTSSSRAWPGRRNGGRIPATRYPATPPSRTTAWWWRAPTDNGPERSWYQRSRTLFAAKLRPPLLGKGTRAFLRVLAGEHGHAHRGLERERLVLRHALGLPDDPQDGPH